MDEDWELEETLRRIAGPVDRRGCGPISRRVPGSQGLGDQTR